MHIRAWLHQLPTTEASLSLMQDPQWLRALAAALRMSRYLRKDSHVDKQV